MKHLLFPFIAATLLLAQTTSAADHYRMNYQGRLTDNSGNPVVDGIYEITFTIWDDSTGGIQLWTQTKNVQTNDGAFNTILQHPFEFLFVIGAPPSHGPFFLQTEIGDDPPTSPRGRLAMVYGSIITHRVVGDVFTSPGGMQILPAGGIPPDDGQPQINLNANTVGTGFWLGSIDETGGESLPVISMHTNDILSFNLGFANGPPTEDQIPPPTKVNRALQ